MKRLLKLSFAVFLGLSQISSAEEAYSYEPGKMIESKADLHCQSLASMSLSMQDVLAISVHTKPKIIGSGHNGKKIVAVSYPYRRDGISFACVFYDYTNGQLQLIEFGHVGRGEEVVTKVNPLY